MEDCAVESFNQHDPTGKVKTLLSSHVSGDCLFSSCGRYRPLLRRWRAPGIFKNPYILFIGMNPSTADSLANDPTVRREWDFAQKFGYDSFVKCNVSDYRGTFPKMLKFLGSNIASDHNLKTILEQASCASRVILCYGNLIEPLQPLADLMVQSLLDKNITLECFGTTKQGSPKHPLYLSKSSNLSIFLPTKLD